MQKCPKCQQVDHIVKAGFIRGQQRFHCKECALYFTNKPKIEATAQRKWQPTILDIASSLGVSPSTVSKALNNRSDINPETRKVILKVAMELNYKPNLLAQSLHRGKSNTIGVVVPNIVRPFFSSVLAGIQQVASQAGYRVMTCQSDESAIIEQENIEALVASRVDGLLISHSLETRNFDSLKLHTERGMPIVHFDRVAHELPTPKVVQQDFLGSFKLVEHLVKQQCKRIAILLGPPDLHICQARLEGYKTALAKYHIPYDDALVKVGDFSSECSVEAIKDWMRLPNPPDGVFGIFYQNAIEMMFEAKKMGKNIPYDIAFVGFGDELLAEWIEPSLTVFHQFPHQIGVLAAQILVEIMDQKGAITPSQHVVEGSLIIRKSSHRV
ncbi:MAG: substrate-binding domain-containing protein [Spirosomataceae bacterium]